MGHKFITGMLCTGALAGSFLLVCTFAYAEESTEMQMSPAQHLSSATLVPDNGNWSASQSLYYKRNWGVEVIGVHHVASGYMLNFRYRIVDPVKAKSLNDMKSKAYVIDEASGTRLAVPAMENVGELRSGAAPEADRTYFMIFGNPGRLVKPGGRVSVVIGNFRVDGLVVN